MKEKLNRLINLIRLWLSGKKLEVTDSNTYFFIIGSGRCGSTLLRVMLERNHDIAVLPEINTALPKACDWYLSNPKLSREEYFSHFYQMYASQKAWDQDLFNRKALLDRFSIISNPSISSFFEVVSSHYCNALKPRAKLIGDKNPYLTFFIPHLKQMFPKAKYIHLIRDGRDVASSWHKTLELNMELETAAKRWNWALKEVERFTFLIKNQLLEIKYEDLVSYPEMTLKRVCKFLDVPFDKVMIDTEVVGSSEEVTTGHHKRSIEKVNTKSIAKWKTSLTNGQIETIKPILSARLKKYGYY